MKRLIAEPIVKVSFLTKQGVKRAGISSLISNPYREGVALIGLRSLH
jgi:hypothetical protein